VIVIGGVANQLADGLSMAAGSYLSIRSTEVSSARRACRKKRRFRSGMPPPRSWPSRSQALVPLVPYVTRSAPPVAFVWSTILTLLSMFVIGALRALIRTTRSWVAGAEMLGLGAVVAAVATTRA
jgi:VIT1/CCC1 family predicted Fe2+/Mn2+ transporter